MNIIDNLRLHYPLPIAKLYTAVQLETDPRLQVQKLVELFEGATRYLALLGLAAYVHHQLADPQVERWRPGLSRPSLGHWVNLLKAVAPLLAPYRFQLLGDKPDQNRNPDAIGEATRRLAGMLDQTAKVKRVKLDHFLEAVTQFRNKKFGHGSLAKVQAKEIVQPLQEGLLLWLAELSVLEQYKLVYLAQVEWQEGQYIFRGIDLNAGDSPFSFTVSGTKGMSNDRVYLYDSANGEFLPLHPFFTFDDDLRLLYLYSELSSQDKLLLRCPYETPGGETPRYLDVSKTIVIGIGEATAPTDDAVEETTLVATAPTEPPSHITEGTVQPEPEPVTAAPQPALVAEAVLPPPPVAPAPASLAPSMLPKLTFDSITQQLEQRVRQVCRPQQVRYPILWIVGPPCSGKTAIVRAVGRRAGWPYIDFTLDSGCLDSLIGQEETYQPEDFFNYVRDLCQATTAEVMVLDEIEPLLGWWSWEEQDIFFQKIARATRLPCGVAIVTRLRNLSQLERIAPNKNQVFEIPAGVEP